MKSVSSFSSIDLFVTFALNDITCCIRVTYSSERVKECLCLFSSYPQLASHDQVS